MRAAQRHLAVPCEYALGSGHETLRRAIARYALRLGCQLQPRNVVATNGCLESITLCLRAVTKPGDIVVLESPTYFGFLEILQSLHLRALEIPTNPRDGVSLDALELALDTQPVKALLISPTLSNPMGGSLPTAERKPGLRVGWIEAGRWTEPVRRMKMATSGSQTTFVELAMAELLGHTGNEAGFRQMRHTIGVRIDEARRLVAGSFPKDKASRRLPSADSFRHPSPVLGIAASSSRAIGVP